MFDRQVPRRGQPLCRNCKYDLSGLDPGGKCPECSLAIGISLGSDRLRGQDLLSAYRSVSIITVLGLGRSLAVIGVALGLAYNEKTAIQISVTAFLIFTITRAVIAAAMCRRLKGNSQLVEDRSRARTVMMLEYLRGIAAAAALLSSGVVAFSLSSQDWPVLASSASWIILLATDVVGHPFCELLQWSLAERVGASRHPQRRKVLLFVEAGVAVIFCPLYGTGPIFAMLLHFFASLELMMAFRSHVVKTRAELNGIPIVLDIEKH